jgi:hypothetical protein
VRVETGLRVLAPDFHLPFVKVEDFISQLTELEMVEIFSESADGTFSELCFDEMITIR